MALVPAKCTQCGGNIEVDDTHEAGICQHCGTPFITEKAINNYNITNNITANVVNIYGGNTNDFEIRACVLEKYNGASDEVVIPDNVTVIGKGAFSNCTGLKSVTIHDGVTSIGDMAFYNCENLLTINIPNSVTKIGFQAFAKCSSLKSINIPNSVTEIDGWAFAYCSSLKSINIPDSVIKVGAFAFAQCSSLKSINIPDSVIEIGNSAFLKCNNLENIKLSNNITEIGFSLFSECTSLTSIELPERIKYIHILAFDNCKKLKKIKIPKCVKEIEGDAFKGCEELTDLVVSNDINIAMDAFYGCKNLININTYDGTPAKKSNFEGTPYASSNGCYIATCIYGSYDCPQVWTLRRYRDYTLDETWYGRLFIKCYYSVSPKLVKWFGNYAWFRKPWKKFLDSMVERLNSEGVADTKYSDKY